MLTRPDDLTDDEVIAALGDGWALAPDRVAYAPVGFGSHHWIIDGPDRRWFASVDDLEARRRSRSESRHDSHRRLAAALGTAHALEERGLSFVVGPTPTVSGQLLWPLGRRYVVALYRWVDGEAREYGPYPTAEERNAVVDLLAAVHAGDPPASTLVDDHLIPNRGDLEDLLATGDIGDDRSWGPGPYAEPARALVERHAEPLRALLGCYDELVARVAARASPLVVTHGEPHRGNTISTADGLVLIDWDTALLAPPERDLWMLLDEDPAVADRYRGRSGRTADRDAVDLYRLWWDLCEISLFTGDLRRPHGAAGDTDAAWRGLVEHLDPARWVEVLRR